MNFLGEELLFVAFRIQELAYRSLRLLFMPFSQTKDEKLNIIKYAYEINLNRFRYKIAIMNIKHIIGLKSDAVDG